MLTNVVVQALVAMVGVAFGVIVGLAALAGVFALTERFGPRRSSAARGALSAAPAGPALDRRAA